VRSEPVTGRKIRNRDDTKVFNEGLYVALGRHRRTSGEKQYEVAARIGVSPAELSRWIYGEASASPKKAAALAHVLGAEIADLFHEPSTPTSAHPIEHLEQGFADGAVE
jgi:transcriptional regulator with XRE-family HTH domain